MQSSRFVVVVGVLVLATAAWAQTPTPSPVDSNVAVSAYAQGNCPTPGQTPGTAGCGGCYPAPIPGSDPTTELYKVNPEWSAIGTMISGLDSSVVPNSVPVLIHGTVLESRINTTGDFPASHQTDDQNTFIQLDPADNGFLATGNSDPASCSGNDCGTVEMEREIGKYPLFAWAGEGDRITALGRWIFDCGHPDPSPGHCSTTTAQSCVANSDCPVGESCVGGLGTCTTGGTRCIIDGDCSGKCTGGTCTNNTAVTCTSDTNCSFGSCNNPAPAFNYRAEMHPPQAIVVQRDKSVGRRPAVQADVYINADAGGAGNSCIVNHLSSPSQLLLSKSCFLHGCSGNPAHYCDTDADCPGRQTCLISGHNLANVNTSNFEFDVPLPTPPPGVTPKLIIRHRNFAPMHGLKATFGVTPGPTPNLHVTVPMTQTLRTGSLPSIFAQRILAFWKGTAPSLTHVKVKFLSLTINNPLKPSFFPFPRQCGNSSGLTGTPCNTNRDCSGGTTCIGGVIPGWNLFGEVNGDWVKFKKLDKLGNDTPFTGPPYTVQPSPFSIKQRARFNEFVPSNGTIHIATTGQSLNCLDILYGRDVKTDLGQFGITDGAACLAAGEYDVGRVDLTLTGPNFNAPTQGSCVPGATGEPTICSVTSTGGSGGTCSVNTSRLCVADADCDLVGTCSITNAACHRDTDCLHCSNNANQSCTSDSDCGTGNTCLANTGSETCNGGDACITTGGSYTLNYSVQVR